jgi:predicted nucleotidyltransferase
MDGLEKQLAELLSSYSDIKLALLFGSQATGFATSSSDIDIALLSDSPLAAQFKLELMEKIGSRFGRPVDIVDLFGAPEPVLGQALKGKRLVGEASDYAALLTRHLFNVADFVPLQRRILEERRNAWIKN